MLNKKRIAGAILMVSMLVGGGTVGSETASADQAEAWEQTSMQELYEEYEEKMKHSLLPSEDQYYEVRRECMRSEDGNLGIVDTLDQARKKYISDLRSYLGEKVFKVYCLEQKRIMNGHEKKIFRTKKEEYMYQESKKIMSLAENHCWNE